MSEANVNNSTRTVSDRSKFFAGCSRLFAFAALLSILLSGCAQKEEQSDFTVVNGPEPESLDPAIITGQAESRIVRALFEGLVRLDPKTASPVPAIAQSWELLDEGK